MGVLLLALNAPLTMMCSVVDERSRRRQQVADDVSRDWGGAQTLSGPVLSIPYRYSWIDSSGRHQTSTSAFHFLPEALDVDGVIEPGTRTRSLFSVVVYTAKVKMRGRFAPPRLEALKPVPEAVLWDAATISLGVADPRGIARAVEIDINGQRTPFAPGSAHTGLFTAGIQAAVAGLGPERADPLRFELDFDVKGTRQFRLLPGGNETALNLTSPWRHPSFVGTTPDPPRIDSTGFAASWRVPYFGRSFPPPGTARISR